MNEKSKIWRKLNSFLDVKVFFITVTVLTFLALVVAQFTDLEWYWILSLLVIAVLINGLIISIEDRKHD